MRNANGATLKAVKDSSDGGLANSVFTRLTFDNTSGEEEEEVGMATGSYDSES